MDHQFFFLVNEDYFKRFIQSLLDESPKFISYDGICTFFAEGNYPHDVINFSSNPRTARHPTLRENGETIAYEYNGKFYINKVTICYLAKNGIAFGSSSPCNFPL